MKKNVLLKKDTLIKHYSTIIWFLVLAIALSHSLPITNHALADKPIYRMQKNTDCHVLGNIFSVTQYDSATSSNRTYTQTIEGSSKYVDLDCGWDVASVYDGKSFYVFDSSNHFFYQTGLVEQNNPYAEVSSGNNLAALYDGSQFIIYDRNKKSFVYEYVKTNADQIFISAGGNVAVLVDGSDIISYDLTRGIFQRTMINTPSNSSIHPVAISGYNNILGYDGTQVYAYCIGSGMWKFFNADENLQLVPMTNADGSSISLVNRYRQYHLNEALCSI